MTRPQSGTAYVAAPKNQIDRGLGVSATLLCCALIGAMGFASARSRCLAADPAPLEWRVLLIIKPRGKIKSEGFPEVRYQMSAADVEAATRAFEEYTPEFVRTLSGGRLAWKAEVVVSAATLVQVAKLGEGNWVSPECIAEDLERYVTAGKYDGVFVYWKDADDKTGQSLKGGFGWSIGPNSAAEGCGYSCVNNVPAERWTKESEWSEVFLHEWLHQLEAFYGARGVNLPRGGLHGNDNYDFKHRNGWKHWYRAFINAELRETNGARAGLGEAAWRLGTIREAQAIYRPEFLTSEHRKKNLLRDGSFEEPSAKAWTWRSWLEKAGDAATTDEEFTAGRRAATIASTTADDAGWYQNVTVKPHARYLLAGWIKSKAVRPSEGGAVGANLSVWGGFEASRSLVDSADWTYVAVEIASGDRMQLEIGARLGHHGSTATGAAWFDDLVFVELPAP